MTKGEMAQLRALLRRFSREEFDFPNYNAGEWSRRNLDGIIEDLRGADEQGARPRDTHPDPNDYGLTAREAEARYGKP